MPGASTRDDLDAVDFPALAHVAVHWAVRHLDPWHGGTNAGPCTTIEEALAPHED